MYAYSGPRVARYSEYLVHQDDIRMVRKVECVVTLLMDLTGSIRLHSHGSSKESELDTGGHTSRNQ